MRTKELMVNTQISAIVVKGHVYIFSTSIALKVFDGDAKYNFQGIMKCLEVSKNFMLVSHRKNPCIPCKIISE